MRKTIIGVMGPGKDATDKDIKISETIGELIVENGWIVLSGGMNNGVMKHVNIGAKRKKGTTVGILPVDDIKLHSENLDIPIITNMRSARNYINALSSDLMIAIGMSAGTASEVCFAIQANKHIIMMNNNDYSINFFTNLNKDLIHVTNDPKEAIKITKKILKL